MFHQADLDSEINIDELLGFINCSSSTNSTTSTTDQSTLITINTDAKLPILTPTDTSTSSDSSTVCQAPLDYCTVSPFDDAREVIAKRHFRCLENNNNMDTSDSALSSLNHSESSPFKRPQLKRKPILEVPPTFISENLGFLDHLIRENARLNLTNSALRKENDKLRQKADDLAPPNRLYERLDDIRMQLKLADKRFKEMTLQRQELLWLLEDVNFSEQSALQKSMYRLYKSIDTLSQCSLHNWSVFNYTNQSSGSRMFHGQRKPKFAFNVNALVDQEKNVPKFPSHYTNDSILPNPY